MGVFTRRKPQAAVAEDSWQFASGPEVVDAAAVEDDGNAGDRAFELRFVSPASPNSAIHVTFYAACADPEDGGYLIGYRYDLIWNGGSYTRWGNIGSLRSDERPYPTPDDALGACWRQAISYAAGCAPIPDEDLNGEVFTWDGHPWRAP